MTLLFLSSFPLQKSQLFTHSTSTPRFRAPARYKCSFSDSDHPLISDEQTQRDFLRTNWNRRPLFLPNLFPSISSPVTGDELAALSERPYHHARIIQHHPNDTETPYTLRHGPYPESIWSELPDENWTLLLQNIERSIPIPANDLLSAFKFLPNWRLDDIQVSYAVPGGGVGCHVDNYDVFLVQVAGTRKWKISNHTSIPPQDEHLIPNIDVRVLKDSSSLDSEYILSPGDVMYVPPRFAHHGIALDDECITFSVGFRAPSVAYLLTTYVDHVIERKGLDDVFYTDDVEDLINGIQNPGRISSQAMDRAFDLISSSFKSDNDENNSAFKTWFSHEMSRKKIDDEHEDIQDDYENGTIDQKMHAVFNPQPEQQQLYVCHQTGSVFTYTQDSQRSKCTMRINGDEQIVDNVEIAKFICNQRQRQSFQYREFEKPHESFKQLVTKLFEEELLQLVDMDKLDDEDYDEELDESNDNDADVMEAEYSEIDQAVEINEANVEK